MSQIDIGRALGVTGAAVSRWESDKQEPDLKTLRRLADVLEVDPGQLAFGDGAAPPSKKIDLPRFTATIRSMTEAVNGVLAEDEAARTTDDLSEAKSHAIKLAGHATNLMRAVFQSGDIAAPMPPADELRDQFITQIDSVTTKEALHEVLNLIFDFATEIQDAGESSPLAGLGLTHPEVRAWVRGRYPSLRPADPNIPDPPEITQATWNKAHRTLSQLRKSNKPIDEVRQTAVAAARIDYVGWASLLTSKVEQQSAMLGLDGFTLRLERELDELQAAEDIARHVEERLLDARDEMATMQEFHAMDSVQDEFEKIERMARDGVRRRPDPPRIYSGDPHRAARIDMRMIMDRNRADQRTVPFPAEAVDRAATALGISVSEALFTRPRFESGKRHLAHARDWIVESGRMLLAVYSGAEQPELTSADLAEIYGAIEDFGENVRREVEAISDPAALRDYSLRLIEWLTKAMNAKSPEEAAAAAPPTMFVLQHIMERAGQRRLKREARAAKKKSKAEPKKKR